MKRLFIAFLVAAVCVLAADPSGKWSGSLESTDAEGPHPLYMIFKADGDKLSGSGGPDETEQHPMENGRVEGDRLIFSVPTDNGTLYFDLRIKADEIVGDVERKGGDEKKSGKVSLKRVAG
jgi:hypothetical protein